MVSADQTGRRRSPETPSLARPASPTHLAGTRRARPIESGRVKYAEPVPCLGTPGRPAPQSFRSPGWRTEDRVSGPPSRPPRRFVLLPAAMRSGIDQPVQNTTASQEGRGAVPSSPDGVRQSEAGPGRQLNRKSALFRLAIPTRAVMLVRSATRWASFAPFPATLS